MKRVPVIVFWLAILAAGSSAAATKVRSGQVDFSDGIAGNVTIMGNVTSTGEVQSETLSVNGAAAVGGRATVGDSGDTLTVAVGAPCFNSCFDSSASPGWILDATNLTASPKDLSVLRTGVLVLSPNPGTKVYAVVVHGVFTDTETGNQLRARVYKENIATPSIPVPITAESVQNGGTIGPFSMTLVPDYVAETGHLVVVQVTMKNTNGSATRLFGIEMIYHETKY